MTVRDIVSLKLDSTLLGERLVEKTESIELAISEAEWKVKNFCHRLDIPEGLYYTVANIAIALLLFWEYQLTPSDTGGALGDLNSVIEAGRVKKISIGDTSVDLAVGAVASNGYASTKRVDEEVDAFLRNYVNELRMFRKTVVTRLYR